MSIQERLKTVDDLWEISHRPGNDYKFFELKDGVIYEVQPPGREHGKTTVRLISRINVHVENNDLGEVTTGTAYYVDRSTTQAPDVAFTSKARMLDASVKGYVPQMPDLAVEVKSPDNTIKELREKAEYYLKHGARLVWIVYPVKRTVDECTLDNAGKMTFKTLREGDSLDGGEVLLRFKLAIVDIFPDFV